MKGKARQGRGEGHPHAPRVDILSRVLVRLGQVHFGVGWLSNALVHHRAGHIRRRNHRRSLQGQGLGEDKLLVVREAFVGHFRQRHSRALCVVRHGPFAQDVVEAAHLIQSLAFSAQLQACFALLAQFLSQLLVEGQGQEIQIFARDRAAAKRGAGPVGERACRTCWSGGGAANAAARLSSCAPATAPTCGRLVLLLLGLSEHAPRDHGVVYEGFQHGHDAVSVLAQHAHHLDVGVKCRCRVRGVWCREERRGEERREGEGE